jgi:hypothetical protein
MYRFKKYLVVTFGMTILASQLVYKPQALSSAATTPVGLSLLFQDGQIAPFTLLGNAPRYLQEVDITATAETTTDQGIQPIVQSGDLARLDWSGVKMVDEDWRPDVDGTFIRQRFYRGAKWMQQPSNFILIQRNGAGQQVGDQLTVSAGKDDEWKGGDDGFVRRFVARQITRGCPAVGDCSGASRFTAQGLVQWRDALHAEQKAQPISPQATRLTLEWNRDPGYSRSVEIQHAEPSAFPYGYGFEPSLQAINPPANGSFYTPGETVSFRVTFRDGQGNRLHPEGSLPTYGEFIRGEITSGLRYYDGFRLFPTTYYALKHREGNSLLTLSGPVDRLHTPKATVGIEQFFAPQLIVATVAADGWSGVGTVIPPAPVLFGGTIVPALWETPVSDIINLDIPSDALPGTYVAALKARRDFCGEALNRAATIKLQVGTATVTAFNPTTGSCNTCHTGPSALGRVLHGVSDRSACYSCHASLAVEPDAALDIRVHMVHDRSARFPGVMTNCSLCHSTPPSGPARGLLGN